MPGPDCSESTVHQLGKRDQQGDGFANRAQVVSNGHGPPPTPATLSKLFNVPQYMKCSAPNLERIHEKILYMLDVASPK